MSSKLELIEYLNLSGFSNKEKGYQIVLEFCPYCENSGNKSKYQHFYFNSETAVFYCHKCQEKGNLNKFMYDRGDRPITKSKIIQYSKPADRNDILSNHNFYEWYNKNRGINPEILKKYDVGYIKNGNKIIFVYKYFNEFNVLINRKYRSHDKTQMWTESNAEKSYYGLQFIDFNKSTLIIVEGEDDCHALSQIGIDNVVSVPYGAGNYTEGMEVVNSRFENLILMFDNDDRGQAGAKSFAEKAGMHKCKNCILPFKDSRECLNNGIDIFSIQKIINGSEYFKHQNIIRVGDVRSIVNESIFNSKRINGYPTKIKQFNKITGGIRLGELSITIGHTGKGKSTFTYNLASWCIDAGMSAMIFPFENRIESVVKKMIEIRSCEKIYSFSDVENRLYLNKDENWVSEWINNLDRLPLFFLNKNKGGNKGYYTLDKVREIIEYANKFYNVNFFVIDHLHYFLKLSDARNPVQLLDESMREIKLWTDKYNCHIVLVVHPHMTQDSRSGESMKLGLNSTKGASSISQEADNFWIIERDDNGGTRLRIEKNREMGKTGSVEFSVLENNNTYKEVDFKELEDSWDVN